MVYCNNSIIKGEKMFCKWCGVKKKQNETRCLKCNMPFDQLVSTGVTTSFVENLHKTGIEENGNVAGITSNNNDFQDENEDYNENRFLEDVNQLKNRNVILKVIAFVLLGFLLISIISIVILVGQLMKNSKQNDDNINNVSDTISISNTEMITEERIIDTSVSVEEVVIYDEADQTDVSDETERDTDSEKTEQVTDSEETEQVADLEETEQVTDSEETEQVADSEETEQVTDSEKT